MTANSRLTRDLKDYAKKCGADLVGIASMDRFEGAPKQMDPRYIFPDAKALIVLGFRIHRGVFRGIEEGTFFAGYPTMGYGGINMIFAPIVLRQVCSFLEDEGYEAVPYHNNLVGIDSRFYHIGEPGDNFWSRSVSPDKPAPDVFIHFRIAAFCAGLGEIGYSKIFLTPEFGPRQRFAVCLTDAPLEPDPLYEGPPLCDRCMLCVKECSGKAISTTETVKVTVAGRELEWGKLDEIKCSVAYTGGVKETNPFLPEEAPDKFEEYSKYLYGGPYYKEFVKWKEPYGFNPAIEGARGCIRACMIHLEQTGRIKNTFKNPFRRKAPWKL